VDRLARWTKKRSITIGSKFIDKAIQDRDEPHLSWNDARGPAVRVVCAIAADKKKPAMAAGGRIYIFNEG
jgi:hypothetical protein